MENEISAIIVDAYPGRIRLIEEIIKNTGLNIKIKAREENVKDALTALEKYRPDIIFLDINMTDDLGNPLPELIDPEEYLVIIADNSDFYRLVMQEHHGSGYILKKIDLNDMFNFNGAEK